VWGICANGRGKEPHPRSPPPRNLYNLKGRCPRELRARRQLMRSAPLTADGWVTPCRNSRAHVHVC
jgi:hypothetical protein